MRLEKEAVIEVPPVTLVPAANDQLATCDPSTSGAAHSGSRWKKVMAYAKPGWRYWLNLAEVPLSDAICLSLDVEPTILQQLDERYTRADGAQTFETFRLQFIARRDAAQTHIRANTLPARYDHIKEIYLVCLMEFRQWGESLPAPFNFPEEFPKSPAPEPVAADASAKSEPSPRNENANLRIIAAMLMLLRDQDGGRFPSDAKVIEMLVEKYGAAEGISKRNLEAVFPAAKRVAGDDLKPQT
jgi:hypothetical protein